MNLEWRPIWDEERTAILIWCLAQGDDDLFDLIYQCTDDWEVWNVEVHGEATHHLDKYLGTISDEQLAHYLEHPELFLMEHRL